jgi:hypothetical protein
MMRIAREPQGNGTRYDALALHEDEATSKRHAATGSRDGARPPITSWDGAVMNVDTQPGAPGER